jgi:hypothetical protein
MVHAVDKSTGSLVVDPRASGAIRDGERFAIFSAERQHEPEPVQQASPHWMLRSFIEQRVGSLESGFCFIACTKDPKWRQDRVRVRMAISSATRSGTVRRLFDQRNARSMMLLHDSGLKCRQSCFGGFDVVAQRRLRLASPLEMGGEPQQRRRGPAAPRFRSNATAILP